MKAKRITAILTTIAVASFLAFSLNASADDSSKCIIDSEVSYVLSVLPSYLDCKGLPGNDVWISDSYSMTDLNANDYSQNAYLVFSSNDYIGLVNVSHKNSEYHSIFISDDYSEIQYAFDNNTPISLYYDDERLSVSLQSGNIRCDNNEYKPILEKAQLDESALINTRSVIYDETLAVTPVSNEIINGLGICWLASLTAKYNYFHNTDFTGSEMYELLDYTLYDTYHTHPWGDWATWISGSADYLEIGDHMVYGPMDYDQIFVQISSDNPIVVGFGNQVGSPHIVLLCGLKVYSEGTGVYTFADPNCTSLVLCNVSYNAMVDGSLLQYPCNANYVWDRSMY